MEVRCPQCHTPIDPSNDSLMSELVCVGCGGTFSLVGDEETVTHRDGKPRTIGHFKLLERIGAGSFGAVWRACDEELDRTVAVKIPRKGNLDSEGVQQFLREAQATAQLRHPNIVSVHEVGRDGDTLYIVNDFVHGHTLRERLVDCRFTPQEAADMCAQLADGLEHAHSAGVIHRDLKPGNILIDVDGEPHIVDFGLARREAGEVTMTLEGQVFGTPAYAPPEQVRGDANQADGRSDVYSLGVVLFEMLTGERPFRGNVQMILQQVIHDDPPSPRSFNGNVPRDLETICLKCLEKSPGRRYQTAGALRDDLRRYLDGVPIRARPVGSLERGKKWVKRHPTVSFLTACVIALTITAVAAVTSRWYAVWRSQREHARTQIDSVLNSDPQVVASVISTLDRFREWIDPELHDLLDQKGLSLKHKYRASLALLPVEPERAEYVFQQLLLTDEDSQLSTAEVIYGAEALRAHRRRVSHFLWDVLEDPNGRQSLRFRAALILIKIQGQSPNKEFVMRLAPLVEFVTNGLLKLSVTAPGDLPLLVDAMRPVGSLLVPSLETRVVDEEIPESQRLAATSFFGEYVDSDLDRLMKVALLVKDEQYVRLLPFLKRNQDELREGLLPLVEGPHVPAEQDEDGLESERRARAWVTLVHLGHSEDELWPLLESSDDMRLRTALIQSFAELRIPLEPLVERTLSEFEASSQNVGILQALLLTLGEYPSVPSSVRQKLLPVLAEAFRNHPDSGTHSAIAWLLRQWGNSDLSEAITTELTQCPPDGRRNWYVNGEKITMAIIRDPPPYLMGSPLDEPDRVAEERRHWRKINRTFAISTTEITVDQFLEYATSDPDCNFVPRAEYGSDTDGPALPVTWTRAAKYCRWLSDREGISEDQMCFPRISKIKGDMVLPEDYLTRTGYRLPTDGEWEYACRAGTVTRHFYGDSDLLVGRYGWYVENSHDRAWPVGSLRPNGLGLFDVYGNVWEWCTDYFGTLPASTFESPYVDKARVKSSKDGYVLRGGSLTDRARALRSAQREKAVYYHSSNHNIGFRVARTMPATPLASCPEDIPHLTPDTK